MTRYIIFLLIVFLPYNAPADPDKILTENSSSVVIVTAYNKKGEALTEGTGFIAGKDGIVVTNFHVVAIASKVKVRAGHKIMDIEGVAYTDREHDIIVLKVKGQALPAVRLGPSGSLKKGERVYIISSSEDRRNIVVNGTFQGIQDAPRIRKALKIHAAVNHGSSGSPVFNHKGEVVGIVTSLIKRGQHIILAMPIDLVREKIVRPQIIVPERTALQAYKKLPDYWFYLGYFLMEAGDNKDAIDVLKEAVKMRPGYADAYYYLGSAYEASGQDIRALDAYRRAAKADPDFSDAYFSLGVACGRLGRYTESVQALKQAVRIEPGYAEAHYNLGMAYLFLKDKESARNEYRILKDLNPESARKLLSIINR